MSLTYRILLLGIILIPIIPVVGQTPAYRYFGKNGEPATEADCFYYEVEVSDSLKSFYCSNGVLRSAVSYWDGKMRGPRYSYYSNSAIRSIVNYDVIGMEGLTETWYRNGKKKSEELFDDQPGVYKVVNYWDSLGNQTVKDGSGFCAIISEYDNGDIFTAIGKILNGRRDSLWLGYKNQSRYYEEQYEAGKFISGISFDKEGNSYNYTMIDQSAHPVPDLQGLYSLIAKNIKYPAEARRKKVQGQILVEFVIEKDGSLSSLKCIKGIGKGCDAEAVRVVNLSKWVPGLHRGQRVRQKFVLPIMFKLS